MGWALWSLLFLLLRGRCGICGDLCFRRGKGGALISISARRMFGPRVVGRSVTTQRRVEMAMLVLVLMLMLMLMSL